MLEKIIKDPPLISFKPPPTSGWYLVLNDIDDGFEWIIVLLDTLGDEYTRGKPMARIWRRPELNSSSPEHQECRLFWIEDDWIDPELVFHQFNPFCWFRMLVN